MIENDICSIYLQKKKKLWENFEFALHSDAQKFPDNKIYASIKIEPTSARKMIKNFDVRSFYFLQKSHLN